MKDKLARVTLLSFLFLSINREFALFHFDLRYILMPLALIALFLTLWGRSVKSLVKGLSFSRPETMLALYFLAALASNAAWMWSDLPLRAGSLANLILVFTLNLIVTLLVVFNRSCLDGRLVSRTLVISVGVLGVSQLAAYLGLPLDSFLSDTSVRILQEGGEHFNLFGQHFRVSGFAEDPNYACLFGVIGLIALAYDRALPRSLGLTVALLSIFGVAVSWSRTIVFGAIGVSALFLLAMKFRRSYRVVVGVIAAFALLASLLAPTMALFIDIDFLQTILTRFDLWERAQHLFMRSPIIGNGLTSFRSYNMVLVPDWYVHCHSTYWSALAESGIVGLCLLIGSMYYAIKGSTSPLYLFALAVFIVFCINFDATYLQIIVAMLAITPVVENSRRTAGQKQEHGFGARRRGTVLFFINSLTGGGAERVGFEMIRAISKEHAVKVITVYADENDYGSLPAHCEQYSLSIPRESSFFYKTCVLLSRIRDVNSFIGNEESYSLITAHLQMSHMLASLTKVGRRTLYVMHGAQWPGDPNRSFGRKAFLFSLYKGKRVVCVSQGIKDELVEFYGFPHTSCCVINNPFDLDEVQRKSLQLVEGLPDSPYILCVGRLNRIKRFDRALKIFAEGDFAASYVLVLLGKGDERDSLITQAQELGIADRVVFAGFSDNPFAWMRNSSICLCTSDSEAFPMGLVEALLCGARVVSSDCDYGPREILTGDLSRYLVSPIDDISRYVAIIRDALGDYPRVEDKFFSGFMMKSILDKYFSEWSDCFELI